MSKKKTTSSTRQKRPSGIRVIEDTPETPQALAVNPEASETSQTPSGATGRLAAIKTAWIEHLRAQGTSESTCLSYQNDLAVAEKHFGSMDNPGWWTVDDVTKFEGSVGVVTTKSGGPKAMPTVEDPSGAAPCGHVGVRNGSDCVESLRRDVEVVGRPCHPYSTSTRGCRSVRRWLRSSSNFMPTGAACTP
jgi:hypothetical protein